MPSRTWPARIALEAVNAILLPSCRIRLPIDNNSSLDSMGTRDVNVVAATRDEFVTVRLSSASSDSLFHYAPMAGIFLPRLPNRVALSKFSSNGPFWRFRSLTCCRAAAVTEGECWP